MKHELTGWSALLAVMLGCGGDIQVSDRSALGCGDPRGDCIASTLQLSTPNRVLRADAAAQSLTPRWTIPSRVHSRVSAPDGGVWLFSTGETVTARRIDADGHELRVVELPRPATQAAPHPNAVFVPVITSVSPHLLGPIVLASWSWTCPAISAPCAISNVVTETQLLGIPEDGTAPFELLEAGKRVRNETMTATRSDDGQQVLLQSPQVARLYTVEGALVWEQPLYDAALGRGGDFLPLDASSWITWARGLDGSDALVTVADGLVDRRMIFDAPFSKNVGARTEILRSGAAGEYTLAMERSTAYPTLQGPLDTDPTPSVPGDLSVVRVRDGVVVDEHLLRHADLPLELDAAAMDGAGNVYLATASIVRDPVTDALAVAPLVCRFAPLGDATCFAMPERVAQLHAGAPNSVLVGFLQAGTLSRYDLPAP